MKLILTSNGIANTAIKNKLENVANQTLKHSKILFCTTASNYAGGEMNDWLVNDLCQLKNLECKIDVCDINGAEKKNLLSRLEWADILYFEGGNPQWLMMCIQNLKLETHLEKLLKTKIWIGPSAGSIVLCPTIINACQDLFGEKIKNQPIEGLGLVNFQFIPHLNSENFSNITRENIVTAHRKLKPTDGEKLFAVDDDTAVFVIDNNIEVVGTGTWIEI